MDLATKRRKLVREILENILIPADAFPLDEYRQLLMIWATRRLETKKIYLLYLRNIIWILSLCFFKYFMPPS